MNEAAAPTAQVMVQVFPADIGKVTYVVLDGGPVSLTIGEAINILRACADHMERQERQR